jgi:predicted small lipoprotein YifL
MFFFLFTSSSFSFAQCGSGKGGLGLPGSSKTAEAAQLDRLDASATGGSYSIGKLKKKMHTEKV